MFFLRKSSLERLPVTMSGVRMGERVLQIGIDDRSLAGAIAAKVGLSGHAAFAVASEGKAAQARSAGATAGVLVDVQVTTLDTLPFAARCLRRRRRPRGRRIAAGARRRRGHRAAAREPSRAAQWRPHHRSSKAGARGIAGVLRSRARAASTRRQPSRRSRTAGFRAARPLAEREGYRFTEGLK